MQTMELQPEQKKYYQEGLGEAWQIIREKMERPPSFEVFCYGYERSLAGSPEEYATTYESKANQA